MSTKNKKKNLKLPQYQNEDLFDMKEVNEAYKIIDESYKEQNDNYKQAIETSTINGAIDNLELIDARKGKRTLGEKISEIDSQLETKANKNSIFSRSTPYFHLFFKFFCFFNTHFWYFLKFSSSKVNSI